MLKLRKYIKIKGTQVKLQVIFEEKKNTEVKQHVWRLKIYGFRGTKSSTPFR
jgi:hypothetical protein